MLSFFRRLTHSKVGVIVTLGVLILIAIMFGLGDVTGLGGTASGDSLATVGGTKIGADEIRQRAQREVDNYRQQNPTLDMTQYVAAGGLDGVLKQTIDTVALQNFGMAQGLFISKRLVDGRIASFPQLRGPDGKFSQDVYDRILKLSHQTDSALRADMKQGMVAQLLVTPLQGLNPSAPGLPVPQTMAQRYASLLLEKRHAQIAVIPSELMAVGAAPNDAELAAYYQANANRYVVPERRAIRYATISTKAWTEAFPVSDAEIAKAYQAQIANFRAVARRTVTRVVAGDKATADAIAAKMKSGASIDDATRAAGLAPATIKASEQGALAAQTSPAFADAVFAAPKGAVIGPLKDSLGYTIGRVDSFDDRAETPLAGAKAQLTEQLVAAKKLDKLRKIHDSLDDAISKRQSFDQLVAEQKLTAQVSPAVVANGTDPQHPEAKLPAAAKVIVDAGFAIQPGDAPQLIPIDNDSFALVSTAKVFPPAPPPLALIKPTVTRDIQVERGARAARDVAKKVMDQVNKGTPIAGAVAAIGLKLPAVEPLDKTRAELSANPRGVPAPLALLFSMAPHTAKMIAAPDNAGWYVIWLDKIDRGDATGHADILAATQSDIGRVIGAEYVQQFVQAVRGKVGVKTDAKALARLKATLTGQETNDQP